jgi:hypothetical protein
MSSVRVRRAAALGLVLALSVTAIATADTIVADGDMVSTGAQPGVQLGDLAPGEIVTLDVAFELTCEGSARVAAGTSVTVAFLDVTVPEDGTATATDGRVDVPGTWPAPNGVVFIPHQFLRRRPLAPASSSCSCSSRPRSAMLVRGHRGRGRAA